MQVLIITAVIVFVDQATKLVIKGFTIPFLNFEWHGMYHGQRIPVIGEFFQFTFVENPGMAFGIELGATMKFLISLFSIIASIGLFLYLVKVKNQSWSLRIALALILGGAIGNLIDRVFYGVIFGYAPLFYGHVVDFFDFDFFNLEILGRTYDRFPIFNVADAAVTIGVFILLIFYKQHQEEFSSQDNQAGNEATQMKEYAKQIGSMHGDEDSLLNKTLPTDEEKNNYDEVSLASTSPTTNSNDGENNNREEIPV